jgi:hypothetical protein
MSEFGPDKNREFEAKPTRLFHASPKRGLDVIRPNNERIRSPEDGAVVFATPDKRMATIFMLGADDSWVQMTVGCR